MQHQIQAFGLALIINSESQNSIKNLEYDEAEYTAPDDGCHDTC